jgi:hypothetical protein
MHQADSSKWVRLKDITIDVFLGFYPLAKPFIPLGKRVRYMWSLPRVYVLTTCLLDVMVVLCTCDVTAKQKSSTRMCNSCGCSRMPMPGGKCKSLYTCIIHFGNNIDVYPNGLFYRDSVMLNVVKHLANVSCKVPARDPSRCSGWQRPLGKLLYYYFHFCSSAAGMRYAQRFSMDSQR